MGSKEPANMPSRQINLPEDVDQMISDIFSSPLIRNAPQTWIHNLARNDHTSRGERARIPICE